MSDSNITRKSIKDIEREHASTPDPTDWERVDRLIEDPDYIASLDDDDGINADWSQAVVRTGFDPADYLPKEQLTLRLDRKVVTFFKSSGRGYQTRMNQVLRDYVEERLKRDAS